MSQEIYVAGFPSAYGGADTELDHMIDLWRSYDIDVHLVPNWPPDPAIAEYCRLRGCFIHEYQPRVFAGKIVVSYCNGEFLERLPEIAAAGRPACVMWVNCMTWNFRAEIAAHAAGLIDVHVFHSDYQRSMVEPKLEATGVSVRDLPGYRPYFNLANGLQQQMPGSRELAAAAINAGKPAINPHFSDVSMQDGSDGRSDSQGYWQILFGKLFSARSILDVGAGLGHSRERLAGPRHTNTVTLQDIAPGMPVDLNCPLDEIPDRSYDVVTAFDVIEHVPDDAGFLAHLCRIARERVVITTPNWHVSKCGNWFHVREYTPAQLVDLASPFGIRGLYTDPGGSGCGAKKCSAIEFLATSDAALGMVLGHAAEGLAHSDPATLGYFGMGRVSRDDATKYPEDFWRIFAKVNSPLPTKTFVLGFGENAKRKCGDEPPCDWLDWLYWEPGATTPNDVYRRIHVLIHKTGGSRENWPRTILEAMAAGVAVIAEDDYALPQLIENGVTGFLCKSSDEMSYRASQLAFDEPLRKKIVRAAYERFLMEHANRDLSFKPWRTLLSR